MLLFSQTSLRTRLITAIILTTLPLLALIWYGAQRQFSRESAALEQEVQRLAAFITGDVNHLLETTRQMLVMAAKISRGPNPEYNKDTLAEMTHNCLYYKKFIVLNPASNSCRTEDAIDEHLLQAALASKKLVVGRFDATAPDGKGLLCVAYCVPDKGDTNHPVVSFAVLDLGWLDALLADERVTGDQSLFPRDMVLNIMDRSGTILARHPDKAKWIGKQFPDSQVFDEITRKGEGTADLKGVTGERRLYAFQSVAAVSGDIMVSIGISRKIALAATRNDVRNRLLGVSAVVLVLILAAWFGTELFITKPVSALVEATRRLSAGDLAARTGVTRGPTDITHLADAFDQMAETMQRDTRDRERLQTKLVEYDDQLRSMAVETALAEEQERRQVAAGLHDKAGPLLAACNMKLGRVLKVDVPPSVTTTLNETRDLINQTIRELRTLTFDLCSPTLYTLGLTAAVDDLCQDVAKHHALNITFQTQGMPSGVTTDENVVLYRAARELLFNVVKHAEASHVIVMCGGDAEWVFVSVTDDGLGFDAPEAGRGFSRTGGFGLFNLRERVTHLGGRFTVDSSRGAGTRVVVTLPVFMRGEEKEEQNGDQGLPG
jgi:signal transduction histidine kinase